MRGYGYRECERCGERVYTKLTGEVAEARSFILGDPNKTICPKCIRPKEETTLHNLVIGALASRPQRTAVHH